MYVLREGVSILVEVTHERGDTVLRTIKNTGNIWDSNICYTRITVARWILDLQIEGETHKSILLISWMT